MSDRFPLMPDSDWHEAMIARYGDAMPPITRLHIRRGLQQLVADLFEFLSSHGLLDEVDIFGIRTRSAAYVVIDWRDRPSISDADRDILDSEIEKTRERLSEVCEHCGRGGEIVLKIGLEAQLADPEVELGDRLLCSECYADWRSRD